MSATLAAGDPDRAATVSLRDWIAVLGGILGAFMAVLDIQVTNASLPNIQGGLGAGLDEGSWISTAYLMAEIIVIPLTGWLGGVFGLKRYLLANCVLFLAFSALCGMATSLPQMAAFRAGQGFTGGVLIPTAFTINLIKLPPSHRPLGSALFGLTATFAPAIGPTIGGWLTENLSWQWIFYVNLLPGALLIAMVWYGLDTRPMQLERLRRGDWPGVALMAVGLGCLVYMLEEGERNDWFGDPAILLCAWLSALCLACFVARQLLAREPLVDLRLLARRGLAAASAVNFATGFALYGSVYILPLYLAQLQGYGALQIGEVQMWMGLPQLAILPFLPLVMRHVDSRIVCAFGITLFAASCLLNGLEFSHDTALDQLRLSQFVRALGQPFIMSPLASMATVGIRPDQAGSASGLFNMMRNLGGSFGIALLSTLADHREQFHFATISERLTANSVALQARLAAYAARFVPDGGGAAVAHMRALAEVQRLVRREALVMAYADCFVAIAAILLLSLAGTTLLVRARPGEGGAAH